MLRKISMLSAIVTVLALTVALPASANGIPTTGTRINLFNPPTTYPANTAFHIRQGAGCYLNSNARDCANADSFFVLSVDGIQQPSQRYVYTDDTFLPGTRLLFVQDLTNFPQGLPAGAHTFHGVDYVNGAVFYDLTVTIQFTP
jgi:hypothetical protein